jgi:hypothetical protein
MATYYIDPAGTDGAAISGDISHPFKTLSYACSRAATVGDIIHVNAGTYYCSTQGSLRAGVTIEGDGPTSILVGTETDTYFRILNLYSSTQGTDGNQEIRNLRFEGNLTAWMAIYVSQRSNVKIHDCEFYQFKSYALMMKGRDSSGQPSTYATGNELYNNSIVDCAEDDYNETYSAWFATGLIGIGGQDGMLIYNNVFDGVTGGRHGYGIKSAADGYNRGIKMYDNELKVNYSRGTSGSWDFALEFWNTQGGIEFYRNEVEGGLDFGGTSTTDPYGYGYAVKIYENEFGREVTSNISEVAFTIESTQSGGFYVFRNKIKNMSSPVRHYQSGTASVSDIYFSYNIFTNIRRNSSTGGLCTFGATENTNYTNIGWYNNTIYNSSQTLEYFFKGEDPQCNFINVELTNNIIVGAVSPIRFLNVDIGTLKVENNLYYNCGSTSPYFYNSTPDTYVNQDNIISDPLMVGGNPYNFALLSSSPAIDMGKTITSISLSVDYDSVSIPIGSAPDIGAYEYYDEIIPDYIEINKARIVKFYTA